MNSPSKTEEGVSVPVQESDTCSSLEEEDVCSEEEQIASDPHISDHNMSDEEKSNGKLDDDSDDDIFKDEDLDSDTLFKVDALNLSEGDTVHYEWGKSIFLFTLTITTKPIASWVKKKAFVKRIQEIEKHQSNA